MDVKTILAVVLSVGVILAYTLLFAPDPLPLEEGAQTQEQTQPQLPSLFGGRSQPAAQPAELAPSAVAAVVSEAADTEIEEFAEDVIRRETDVFEIGFSRTGGTIASLRLKDHVDVNGQPVELVHRPDDGTEYLAVAFGGVDTVPSDDPFAFRQLDPTTWEFSRDFAATDGTPFRLTKTYRFDLEYLFELRIRIENSVNAVPALDFGGVSYTLGIAPQLGPDYAKLDRRNEYREYMRYYPEGRRKRQRLRNDLTVEERRVRWTSIVGKYFTLVVIPDESDYRITYDGRADADIDRRTALYLGRPTIASVAETDVFRIYAGPKDRSTLTRYNDPALPAADQLHLEETVSTAAIIGWLANIVRFMLDAFYRVIPNYGVAIILLTVFIKALFFPLTRKSSESTKRMAQLQPKIEELKNKFKGKPERLNQATMELYKREKVNPIGGCLPMLLQMPIFFALYTVLIEHFDLRGAAFIVPWIADLSAPESFLPLGFQLPLLGWDELRLLPFFMLGSTFLQTRIMPTAQTANATQMKMLQYAMPIFFFFILYDMPSGLVLYWTVQNILTVVQQLYINSRGDKPGKPRSGGAAARKKRPA
jgi:YidC/Oxa1 family membrane protein insertase